MRKINNLLLALSACLLIACSDDSTTTANTNTTDALSAKGSGKSPDFEGRWNLIRVTGSIAGVTNEFPEGTIVWTIDESAGTVDVVNNNDEPVEDFFDTGVYNYNFVASEMPSMCSQTIEVNQLDLGCVEMGDNGLTFTQTYSDGYVLTFKR